MKYLLALVIVLISGCSLLKPSMVTTAEYAHKAASEYCTLPEPVRLEIRKSFVRDEAKGPWVQVNCEAL